MNMRRTPAGRPESASPEDDSTSGIRLNKFLAQNGIASRRGADELIARGNVLVDGKVVTALGTRVDPARQRIEVDGIVLQPMGERPRYYLLNKPRGVVCTNDPREGRPRAIDLVTDRHKGRIYTVGRLDEETEGLVILTNDGEFANRISHPRYGVQKTYWVDVRGRVDEETVRKMQQGVRLAEGLAGFERVRVQKKGEERSILLVTLGEGKNREVRRVLAQLGLPVRHLRRVEIGPLRDRKLKSGQWRVLTKSEVGALLEATRPGARAGVRPRRFTRSSGPARRPWSTRPPPGTGGKDERAATRRRRRTRNSPPS
jgi:23S rRNA pseudouridine2605 synthase